jgi:hypothetical protein
MKNNKLVVVTIEDDGNLTFLATESSDVFLELGRVITRRASHVYPSKWWKRVIFRLLRTLTPDAGRIAAWTRTWQGPWLVDTKPTAGVVLGGRWMNRQGAIDAEVVFLNDWFAERGTK